MELDVLTAISPIDGRYRGKTKALAAYFSEFALIKYRVQVEVEYFITLCELPLPQLKGIDNSVFETLRNIYRNFSEADAQRIKDIESVTNHDVKAVEYFLKEEFDKLGGMDDYKEFIHFGLTSQDINNTSVPLSIKEALEQVYYPLIEELIAQLKTYATDWADIPMLAKTHGQPASPTRLGKEVMVFVYRLERQLAMLKACPITAKFGGATGNYNAHHVAYPEFDWKAFGNKFVAEKLKGSDVKVCTVVGFPLGMSDTRVKAFETRAAIEDGAQEVDMVINVGALKDGKYDFVRSDIQTLKEVCGKDIVLKVIIETCLLTDEEKVKACELAKEAGADFVKTSTGFSTGGAKAADVALMRKTVGPDMGVKASGGIHNADEAQAMVDAGASRLGTSATLAIIG